MNRTAGTHPCPSQEGNHGVWLPSTGGAGGGFGETIHAHKIARSLSDWFVAAIVHAHKLGRQVAAAAASNQPSTLAAGPVGLGRGSFGGFGTQVCEYQDGAVDIVVEERLGVGVIAAAFHQGRPGPDNLRPAKLACSFGQRWQIAGVVNGLEWAGQCLRDGSFGGLADGRRRLVGAAIMQMHRPDAARALRGG